MASTHIQNSIDYIEQNLFGPLSLTDCAAAAGYSSYHFCRLFHTSTGMTVTEYIRRRRVSRAAVLMNETPLPLKDIAVRCGFQSQENFVRVFRKIFGILPTEYRKSRYSLPLQPKLLLTAGQEEDYSGMQPPLFVDAEEFWVAGIRRQTTFENSRHYKDVPVFWNQFYARRDYEKLLDRPGGERVDYGVSILGNTELLYEEGNERRGLRFSYLTGTRSRKNAALPPGFELFRIPAHTYAVFESPPSTEYTLVQNLMRTWNFIDYVWLPNSAYVHAGCCEFNEYRPQENRLLKKIYIPVSPKREKNR